MKTTSFGLLSFFSLIFVIIVLPMHVQNDNRLRAQERVQENIVYYDGALRAAVQDAGVALASNERQIMERDIRYESEKKFRPDKELAVETFFRTLHINFDIVEDPLAQDLLHRYIPAVSVIDYDGFWVYADDEFDNAASEKTVKPVWYAKKPYAYADRFGNSLSFTLDEYVYAYDAATESWHQGQREDVNAETGGRIALLSDADTFDQVRRLTIVQTIQSELEHYINHHNERTRRLGFTYTFTLPTISQEEWNNTIDDVGFIAFLQGVPAGNGYYNNYAFGGGRLVKKQEIYGASIGGRKVYYRAGCGYSADIADEIFWSEKEAARNGYYPALCENVSP